MKEHAKTLFRLWNIFKPFHKWFYLELALIFISQCLFAAGAIINSKTMNALVDKNMKLVFMFLAIRLSFELFQSISNYARMKIDIKHLGITLKQHIQAFSLKRVLSLTVAQHTEEHSALKLTIISNGEERIADTIDLIITSILPTFALLIISFTTLLVVYPKIALLVFVFFVILLVWSIIFTRSQYPLTAKNRDNWNEQTKQRTEAFGHLLLVKMLGRENQFIDSYLQKREKIFPYTFYTNTRFQKHMTRRAIFTDLASTIVAALAVFAFFNGTYSLGVIYLILSMTSTIFGNVRALAYSMREIPQMFTHIDKYLSIINKEPNFSEKGQRGIALDGDIVLRDISFSYPKSEGPVLNHCSILIPSGRTTAFVGHSGSGKSTIARLLLRAYDYSDGSISIGGIELNTIDAQYLREHVGYVEQHVDLFDDTVKNNILIALPKELREEKELELDDIGEKTRISEFYHRLGESKWETLVGERGVKLSGGERQRIGIARAIVKNPDFLIFDEATASLDTVNEKHVMDAINDITKGKTTIIVAHRLSTVRNADKIVVLDKGMIVAEGTHDELMQTSPHYQELVAHQMQN